MVSKETPDDLLDNGRPSLGENWQIDEDTYVQTMRYLSYISVMLQIISKNGINLIWLKAAFAGEGLDYLAKRL